MTAEPFVSVVTIFLNAERFLAEAVQSVLGQSYPHFELLLVDDGSTDGSTRIARGFAEAYPARVRYLEHDGHRNRGMSASRNLGIREARGSYVAFLDADDVWTACTLEEQVGLALAHPEADLLYGSTQLWHSWRADGRGARRDGVRNLGVDVNRLYAPPDLLVRFLANEARPPATCSVLARRAAIERAGGFEECFRGLHEDQAFFAKMSAQAPIYVSDRWWGRYRQHADSCCSQAAADGRLADEQAKFLRWLAEYVVQSAIPDPRVRSLVRRRLWPYRHPALYRMLERARGRARDAWKLLHLALGPGPWLAYERRLVPPRSLRRREGSVIYEEWFRRAAEWSLLLRLYGGLTSSSSVLEIGCRSGRVAHALRYIIGTDGLYRGLDPNRAKIAFLTARYRTGYPHFRFAWTDVIDPKYNPGGSIAPSRYRFPYPEASFDLVFSASEFRHLGPDGLRNYVREAARVLRPSGRCVFSFFLLDHYRAGAPRPRKFSGPEFDFERYPIGDDMALATLGRGEQLAAYRSPLIEHLARESGLAMAGRPLPGHWSGSAENWVEEHDVVILEKAEVSSDGERDRGGVGFWGVEDVHR